MQNYSTLTVDLDAIAYNLEEIKALQPPSTSIMAMVKADAYGTGSLEVTSFLQRKGYFFFGLSYVSEAVFLRKNGIIASLFVISSLFSEAPLIAEHDLEAAVSDEKMAHELSKEACRLGKTLRVHLHVDTGMNRFGCPTTESLKLAKTISALPGLILHGVMTHFVGAENPLLDGITLQQIKDFKKVVETLHENNIHPRWVHCANTAGALRFPLEFCNLVRIGVGLLGLYSSDVERNVIDYKPAVTLTSTVKSVQICNKDETVGYHPGYLVMRPQEKIAVVAIGYHDGLHLIYSGKAHLMIRGIKAPLVGRICMDFLMVDVTDVPDVAVGDSAVVIGTHMPAEAWAKQGQTNVRELIVCLTNRVKRQFVSSPQIQNTSELELILGRTL